MASEHAVLVEFRYAESDLERLHQLEADLAKTIEAARAGEFDGDELAVDGSQKAVLYTYGPNADRLFDVVRPILEKSSLMTDAVVIKRYGGPRSDAIEVRVKLVGRKD